MPVVKVVIASDEFVGKTSLIQRFSDGIKIDLHRLAPHEQVEVWAKSKNFPCLETSALSEVGVKEFFSTLGRLAYSRPLQGRVASLKR